MRVFAWLAVFGLLVAEAAASLQVVATLPNMGMLARVVGGDDVQVRVLAPPNRDAHYLEARPSMMAALRRADLVVAVGAELEVGWLPAAIRGAQNRNVQPGRPGYFEAAAQVALIGGNKPADRALGDVHPQGNPHIYMDPERMAAVGFALAARLGELRPERAAAFQARAEQFAAAVTARMSDWRAQAAGAKGVLLYHQDADYLLHALDVPILGYLEPLPGIPPTAAHLRELLVAMQGQQGVIWSMNYHPSNGGAFLSRELGWPAVQWPCQVDPDGDAEAYFDVIQRWVDALEKTN